MPDRTIRVLYVDDDPALARLAQRALQRRGYTVDLAGTGEEGVERSLNESFDVVALDHYLPTGTGLDYLPAIRDRDDAPAIVYVTGSAELAVAVAALKAGAADYVPKSVGPEFLELLASAIDQAVEKARLSRAKERAEREMRDAKERAELLLGEVNHRVANSLAIVAALTQIQANALSEPAAKDALEETTRRIAAIAGVHRRLYTSDDVRFVAIADYLTSLVEELGVSMNASGLRSAIKLDVEPMAVATDKAVSLGVIATELITNAFKYAYPKDAAGDIRVSLRRADGDKARLTVADDGVGFDPSAKPKGTGVGSRVIRAMASSLGSKLEFAPGAGAGTRATLCFALQ